MPAALLASATFGRQTSYVVYTSVARNAEETPMHENEQSRLASSAQDFTDVPLTSGVARRIIVDLFQQQPQWRRKELAAEVERIHLAKGGTKGQQAPQAIVKKALTN